MALFASQTHLMRKEGAVSEWAFNRARIPQRARPWARAAGRGASAAFGFFPDPSKAGRMRFMGGSGYSGLLGAGVGAAVYGITDSPLLGIGAGLGTSWAMNKSLWKGAGALMKGAMPMFIGLSAVEGYREGGVGGATAAVATDVALFAAFDVGLKGLGMAVTNPLLLAGVGAAAIGFTAYKAAQGLASLGRESVRSEFVGDVSQFMTSNAITMRQRALQEISRSHTNSRTLIGSEAMLMHM